MRAKTSKSNNKRHYFRLTFQSPLGAELKIIGAEDVGAEMKWYQAALVDLSAGGARFYTSAPLPETENLLTELRFTILNVEHRPYGVIVRSILPEAGHYEYCIQFSWQDSETNVLTRMLHQLALRIRRNPIVSGCSFLTEEELAAFSPNLTRLT
ncbi:PilZ domain-containing protein [Paenibacillus sp. YYML68]|uniref:PilZ domain-containing protein n=1 Tax=Paenibacillus sp. YYML68 TaxID=2909250 RepID=UPI002492EF6F|nr:PilZ domain-containing protein [Paenibacillus sp. YYML68]